MKRKLRLLVITTGQFSGIFSSLVSALRRNGCEVVDARSSLRCLRFRIWYILLMIVQAMAEYGRRFRQYLNRTYAAYMAKSKANHHLVATHDNIDAVLMIGANALNFWKLKAPPRIYTLFTDHTNLLSKKLPDHGYDFPEKHVSWKWNDIERHILAQQDHIFVMGSHVKHSMVEDYGIRETRITIVGSGPNLDLDVDRDAFPKRYDAQNVLFVGIDAKRKGLEVLERAFESVVQVFPKAMLHVVGTAGINSNNVKFYGELSGDPLRRLFYESQVFVLPSFREPFGIVFLEAMHAKTVCIGTNIEAIPEIIEDGETGYLVEPGDAYTVSERIIHLFSDPALMQRMAEKAYCEARDRWTWDRTAVMIMDTISSLLPDQT